MATIMLTRTNNIILLTVAEYENRAKIYPHTEEGK